MTITVCQEVHLHRLNCVIDKERTNPLLHKDTMAAKPNRGLRRRRRRRGFFADLWRSSQLSVCWTALAILLCFHLWILRRCYNSCLRTSGHVGLKNWQFIDYPNETQSISRIGVDKGPFGSWREAFNALKEIRRRDIQNEISAPLNAAYRRFRDEPIRLDHLPHPPAWCNRFYDHDSPIDIDLALTRMMGHNFSRIPSDFVRNVSLTVDITTNYTTRFPLRKSATIYVLKDGVLYFDRRSNHPRQCGHQHKIVGFLTFMQATFPLGLPDVAFRFGCLDNPYPPLEGLWTYSSFKEADRGPLAFPDDYFTFERWQRLRPDPAEPAYRDKPLRAAWHGSRTGDKPLHHAYRQGFLETVSVELLENVTSREYFVGRYADGSDDRITASFDKVPISQLLRRSRVLLAIAGHSFASNTLPLLSSNSLVVAQVRTCKLFSSKRLLSSVPIPHRNPYPMRLVRIFPPVPGKITSSFREPTF